MSRSLKHTPISGHAIAISERKDKQRWHRTYRRAVKQAIARAKEPPAIRELSDPWSMCKDGKSRFDAKKYPMLMRK